MRLEQFQYVVEIAHSKSMSKASKKLYITQPSLSTAIQNFEDELGFQIFKRSSQGVSLTDKGAVLLDIAENIVKYIDEVKELSNPDNQLASNVVIAAVPIVCNALTINLIERLRYQKDNINLQIQELRPAKILPALLSGSCDLALGIYYNSSKEQIMQEAARNNIIIEPIFKDSMYAFLPRDHTFARQKSVAVADLLDDTPIFFTDHTLIDNTDDKELKDSEIKNHYYSFNDRNTIKQAISKGLGYALLPHLMAVDDLYVNSGMVVPRPLNDTKVSLTIFLAYPGKHTLTKAEEKIISILKELFTNIQNRISNSTTENSQEEEIDNCCNYLIFY